MKRTVEAWAGVTLSNTRFTRLLETLVKLGMVERNSETYRLSDPLFAKAVED